MQKIILFSLLVFSIIFLGSCKQNTKNASTESANNEEQIATVKLSDEEVAKYKQMGKSIAMSTFKSMSGNLKKSLKKGGIKEAVEYCNTVAGSLTDSLSQSNNAVIKRTSNKLRNTDNKASKDELTILSQYISNIKDSIALTPIVQAFGNDKVKFYAPIKLKEVCLSCHGVLDNRLTTENYTLIKKLYPEDEAINYKEGDFRGIWSIEMERGE